MTLEERNARTEKFLSTTPPRPVCTVCGTSDRSKNVVTCHWCQKYVCIDCYYNRDHEK
jgi:transposase-like protein